MQERQRRGSWILTSHGMVFWAESTRCDVTLPSMTPLMLSGQAATRSTKVGAAWDTEALPVGEPHPWVVNTHGTC